MRRTLGGARALALALALPAAACGPTGRDSNTRPDADTGGPDSGTGGDSGTNPNGDGCSDDAKLVYVVDQNRQLSQFHPATKAFTDLGTLACTNSASPFSMAIARDATAWVLYSNGELFRVETKNGLACTKAAWTTTQGLKVFGMGFSTDQVGGSTDTLFIVGGPTGPTSSSKSKLARVDMSTFQPTAIKTDVTGWPELTGTGAAELWGFFPSASGTNIAQLDKVTGNTDPARTFPLGSLNGTASAWAFAFHGGSFWIFHAPDEIFDSQEKTTVYQVNATTGSSIGTPLATNRKIVGAGVSTCAPIIL